MQLDQEGVIELLKNAPFTQDRLNLVLIDQLVLSKDLDGIKSSGILLSSKCDFAETAAADHSHLLEVLYHDVFARGKACLRQLPIQL